MGHDVRAVPAQGWNAVYVHGGPESPSGRRCEIPDVIPLDVVDRRRDRRARRAGVRWVVVTCGDGPTIAHLDGGLVEVRGPRVAPVDDSGTGDSVTAGLAAALARGASITGAMRLGTAGGSLNVTRHGRGSGSRREIELLSHHATIEELT